MIRCILASGTKSRIMDKIEALTKQQNQQIVPIWWATQHDFIPSSACSLIKSWLTIFPVLLIPCRWCLSWRGLIWTILLLLSHVHKSVCQQWCLDMMRQCMVAGMPCNIFGMLESFPVCDCIFSLIHSLKFLNNVVFSHCQAFVTQTSKGHTLALCWVSTQFFLTKCSKAQLKELLCFRSMGLFTAHKWYPKLIITAFFLTLLVAACQGSSFRDYQGILHKISGKPCTLPFSVAI